MEKRTLTIIDTAGNMKEIDLDAYGKHELILGRNSEICDIVIPDNIVSKEHGVLHLVGHRVLYMDLDSSNGTFISNGSRRFLLNQRSGFVDLYDKSVLRIGDVHSPDKMILILYRISSENEVWQQAKTEDVMHIGRNRKNEIVLPHPGVSTLHAVIKFENQQYVLYDQGSTNGTMVNGQTITKPVVLADKDLIQILDFQLIFSTACVYYKTRTEGISVRVEHVNKYVKNGHKKKQILKDVSCEIKANEFVAIIGGSGAGKTTLMNAISGFEPTFEGDVYCNGIHLVEQFQNLKNIIGFVPQQDIIYENLTLKRMLMYTAKMKMPKDTDRAEIKARIEEVLEMVDLKEHQNTYIRKLSGGQKKRASIAVELLADPKLFFLDEPTSGLDPGTEKNLMMTLSRLAKTKNKTIIMVTHTTANLHLCDKIIFMGPGGRLCFCGNVEEAKGFYETDDLVNIYNMIADNPSVWEKRYAAYREEKERRRHQTDYAQNAAGMSGVSGSPGMANRQAGYASVEDDMLMSENGMNASGHRRTADVFKHRNVSAFRQYAILTKRYAELLFNDRPRLLVLLMQPLLIAALLAMVAAEDVFDIYDSTKSMLFALSCSGIWIGLFDSIQEICKERVIVKREYMANLKLPGYVMSKFTMQAILGLIQGAMLSFTFLKLVDADCEGVFSDHFQAEIFLTVWLTILASIAMGFVISAVMKTGDKAMTLAPFVLIIQLLFSGILFDLEGIGKIISFCTVSRWSVEGLGSIAHLNDLTKKVQQVMPMAPHDFESCFDATGTHLVMTWGLLILMTAAFTFISMLALKRVAKDSR